MELHQLKYFSVLCQELNYSIAAKKCYISRQAMRQAVRALEEEYRVTLIENQHNHLSVTPAGRLLQKNAEAVLHAVQQTDTELRSFALHNRAVRIGVSLSLMPFYAPEILHLLGDLSTPFPSLRFEIVKQDADKLLEQLDRQELDAVIVVDLGCLTEGYHRTILRKDRIAVLIAEMHPLARKRTLKLKNLEGQTISVMSSPKICFRPLVEAMESQGVRAEFQMITDVFDAFRAIRGEGMIGIDRLEATEDGHVPIGLEIDLPIEDFPQQLETVLLMKNDPPRELLLLAQYMKEKLLKQHTN